MFNDPEVSATKAIEFMEEHDFVEPTPAGVARLFREKAGKRRPGEEKAWRKAENEG